MLDMMMKAYKYNKEKSAAANNTHTQHVGHYKTNTITTLSSLRRHTIIIIIIIINIIIITLSLSRHHQQARQAERRHHAETPRWHGASCKRQQP